MLDGAPGRYARPYDFDAIRIGKETADDVMVSRRAVAHVDDVIEVDARYPEGCRRRLLGCRRRLLGMLGRTALTHHDERRPVGRMRLVRLALVDQRQHGAAQGLGPTDLRIAGHLANGGRDQLDRGIRVDRPVRDQQGPGLCVDEGPRQARQRLGARCRRRLPCCRPTG